MTTSLLAALHGRLRGLAFPTLVYAASRVVDGMLIWWFTRGQVAMPDSRYPGYHVAQPMPADPDFWAAHTLWDGQWYRTIAEVGYPVPLPVDAAGVVERSPWAFYPAYPMLVRGVMVATRGSFEVVAPLVSALFGLLAVCALYRLLHASAGAALARLTVVGVCCYAAAPIFQVAYPESMALLLLVTALACARHGRWGWYAAAALVLALTRPLAAPLGAGLVAAALVPWPGSPRPEPARRRALLVAGVATAGLALLWPGLVGLLTGRADAFVATASAWTPGLGSLFPGFAVWWTSAGWSGLVVLLAAVGPLIALPFRRSAAAWGADLRGWLLAYVGYLLATTVPGPSHLRYLALLGLWPLIPAGLTSRPRARGPALVLVGVLGLTAQVLWVGQFWRLVGATP